MTDTTQPRSSRPRSRRFGGPPPRIAFVVDWLEDPYQGAVLAGAAQAAQLRGANLVVIPGGVLDGGSRNKTPRNQLYELISAERYDGLIIMTGTLGSQLGEDAVDALCHGYPKSRVCSIAIALEDSPSVLIDNRRGTQSAIEHLIREHKHQKIAFIRGPASNAEAEARYWAYKDVLEVHGLPFDERLVCEGNFQRDSGVQAVKTLLDDRGWIINEIDAIVAADDLMLLGALDELKSRKLRVPEDVALMGFDDIEDARYANPPLSSVHQPFEEQGKEAVRAVLAAISGQENPGSILVATTDQFRRSCGCIPDDDSFYTERPPASSSLDLEASLIRQRELILAQLTRSARGTAGGAGRGWELVLYNSLVDEFKGQTGAFRGVYNNLLQKILDAGGDVSIGHALITGLRRELNIAAGENTARVRQVESLLHDARVLTSQAIERHQASRRIQVEHWARVLSDVSARLITTYDLQRLAVAVAEQLPRLGIHSCYISRYLGQDRQSAELLIGFGPWGQVAPEADPILFDSKDLVPPTLLAPDEHATLVVEPLATEEDIFGFVVFDYGKVEGYVYEVLRELLTASLRGAMFEHAAAATASP